MGSIVAKNKYDPLPLPLPLLSEEVIRGEILIRLPVKSLVRFRCVCKSWQSLLTCDLNFVQSHLTHKGMDLNNHGLICISVPSCYSNKKFHPLISKYLNLAGSVNGLVCVYHWIWDSFTIPCLGIWNPATNQYKDIPPPLKAAFIPNYIMRFGFDPIANDYKVVYITTIPNTPLVADVYSCNAGSWGKFSVTSTFVSRGHHFIHTTIVHGNPYWFNYNVKSTEHLYVMSFDIRQEVFRLFPRPVFDDLNGIQHDIILADVRDFLAAMVSQYTTSTVSVDVYILDEICGVWSKNYTVRPINLPMYMSLNHCFKNGDLVFTVGKYLKVVSINPQTHAINRLGTDIYLSSRFKFAMRSDRFCYIESLVSVKGMNQIHTRKDRSNILIIQRSF